MAEEIVMRKLTIRSFHCEDVTFADDNTFKKSENNYKMTIKKDIAEAMKKSSDLIEDCKVEIIKPDNRHIKVNTIMDVAPISVKALGKIGEGITHTITGVYLMITGVDTDGRQISAFGNSDGYLDEHMIFNQPGTPGDGDYIIWVDFLVKAGFATKRIGPDSCHAATELICEPIRQDLKAFRDGDETEKNVYEDIIRPGKRKVCVVKLVSGQGAMYDTHYLSKDPSGFTDSRSIIDSVGSPIVLSPNEYRDGALRCLYG